MSKKKTPPGPPSSESNLKRIPLFFRIPEDKRFSFANHMIVQHDANSFFLSFFEAEPPVLTGTPEEREEQLRTLEGVNAYCVSRLVIPAERMDEFVKAITGNLERHKQATDSATNQKTDSNGFHE